jgi:hypothetical protein
MRRELNINKQKERKFCNCAQSIDIGDTIAPMDVFMLCNKGGKMLLKYKKYDINYLLIGR